jgi:hypothetical protein
MIYQSSEVTINMGINHGTQAAAEIPEEALALGDQLH